MKECMKFTTHILCIAVVICLVSSQANAQQSPTFAVEDVLKVYQRIVDPYLKKFSRIEVDTTSTNPQTAQLIVARYNMLQAKTLLIRADVKTELDKMKNKPTKEYVQRIIDQHYKAMYTGLPKKFFDDAHKQS